MNRILKTHIFVALTIFNVSCQSRIVSCQSHLTNPPYGVISWGKECNGLKAGISFLGVREERMSWIASLGINILNVSDKPIMILKTIKCNEENLQIQRLVNGIDNEFNTMPLKWKYSTKRDFILLYPGQMDVYIYNDYSFCSSCKDHDYELLFIYNCNNIDNKELKDVLWKGDVQSGIIHVTSKVCNTYCPDRPIAPIED